MISREPLLPEPRERPAGAAGPALDTQPLRARRFARLVPALGRYARRLSRARIAGFTLLEVMIAVTILAVGLSSLFTSEAGAVRIAQRAQTTTIASLLARCKMGELEERVLKEGWPADRIEDRDECCEEGEHDGFHCESMVERIKLPELAEADGGVGSSEDEEQAPKKTGIIDQLAELNQSDPKERMNGLSEMLSGAGGPEESEKDARDDDDKGDDGDKDEFEEQEPLDPVAAMVMEIAFPIMKPVIEEGVRRATVTVKWKEGDKEQTFELVQFLVSEQQIILPEGEDEDGGAGQPGQTSTTPSSTTSSTPATNTTSTGK